ncbi:Di-trans-poly-cis-decaprenylcistransferase [Sistotremastrum suecicum HHB10207 ss-3]|uniref:Alkyl transferase n=1 Tax=Sistotremastrum suecicum HHB10207 ss-3 TaxID=1314776 RepID=A0A166AM36_9AGAM|nr:Di-trans-poly-cis-decaprenylcistransferase [Sistotremastrum suecicum HHB10207 ss-3]
MKWLADNLERFLIWVLSSGPLPRHVAFVMDGNRRYARQHQKRVFEGHSDGFMALRRVLRICMLLGVETVTVYAFSIENFKRSQEEVEALMSLAEDKLIELCEHGDILDQYGVRLNVLGKRDLLPESVRAAAERAESLTRQNDKAMLNLCMPYTSREEMATAVQSTVEEALASDVDLSSLTEKDVDKHLYTSQVGSPPVDILIRTSGVKRLSDFLLWQCCEDTQIQFTPTYWPDFGLRDMIPILLDYQRSMWSRQR